MDVHTDRLLNFDVSKYIACVFGDGELAENYLNETDSDSDITGLIDYFNAKKQIDVEPSEIFTTPINEPPLVNSEKLPVKFSLKLQTNSVLKQSSSNQLEEEVDTVHTLPKIQEHISALQAGSHIPKTKSDKGTNDDIEEGEIPNNESPEKNKSSLCKKTETSVEDLRKRKIDKKDGYNKTGSHQRRSTDKHRRSYSRSSRSSSESSSSSRSSYDSRKRKRYKKSYSRSKSRSYSYGRKLKSYGHNNYYSRRNYNNKNYKYMDYYKRDYDDRYKADHYKIRPKVSKHKKSSSSSRKKISGSKSKRRKDYQSSSESSASSDHNSADERVVKIGKPSSKKLKADEENPKVLAKKLPGIKKLKSAVLQPETQKEEEEETRVVKQKIVDKVSKNDNDNFLPAITTNTSATLFDNNNNINNTTIDGNTVTVSNNSNKISTTTNTTATTTNNNNKRMAVKQVALTPKMTLSSHFKMSYDSDDNGDDAEEVNYRSRHRHFDKLRSERDDDEDEDGEIDDDDEEEDDIMDKKLTKSNVNVDANQSNTSIPIIQANHPNKSKQEVDNKPPENSGMESQNVGNALRKDLHNKHDIDINDYRPPKRDIDDNDYRPPNKQTTDGRQTHDQTRDTSNRQPSDYTQHRTWQGDDTSSDNEYDNDGDGYVYENADFWDLDPLLVNSIQMAGDDDDDLILTPDKIKELKSNQSKLHGSFNKTSTAGGSQCIDDNADSDAKSSGAYDKANDSSDAHDTNEGRGDGDDDIVKGDYSSRHKVDNDVLSNKNDDSNIINDNYNVKTTFIGKKHDGSVSESMHRQLEMPNKDGHDDDDDDDDGKGNSGSKGIDSTIVCNNMTIDRSCEDRNNDDSTRKNEELLVNYEKADGGDDDDKRKNNKVENMVGDKNNDDIGNNVSIDMESTRDDKGKDIAKDIEKIDKVENKILDDFYDPLEDSDQVIDVNKEVGKERGKNDDDNKDGDDDDKLGDNEHSNMATMTSDVSINAQLFPNSMDTNDVADDENNNNGEITNLKCKNRYKIGVVKKSSKHKSLEENIKCASKPNQQDIAQMSASENFTEALKTSIASVSSFEEVINCCHLALNQALAISKGGNNSIADKLSQIVERTMREVNSLKEGTVGDKNNSTFSPSISELSTGQSKTSSPTVKLQQQPLDASALGKMTMEGGLRINANTINGSLNCESGGNSLYSPQLSPPPPPPPLPQSKVVVLQPINQMISASNLPLLTLVQSNANYNNMSTNATFPTAKIVPNSNNAFANSGARGGVDQMGISASTSCSKWVERSAMMTFASKSSPKDVQSNFSLTPTSHSHVQVNKETEVIPCNRFSVEMELRKILKPMYVRGEITKEEYKEIMRKAVPKICLLKRNLTFVELSEHLQTYIDNVKR